MIISHLKNNVYSFIGKTTTTSNAEAKSTLCVMPAEVTTGFRPGRVGAYTLLSVRPSRYTDTQRSRRTGCGPSTSPPVRKACLAKFEN